VLPLDAVVGLEPMRSSKFEVRGSNLGQAVALRAAHGHSPDAHRRGEREPGGTERRGASASHRPQTTRVLAHGHHTTLALADVAFPGANTSACGSSCGGARGEPPARMAKFMK